MGSTDEMTTMKVPSWFKDWVKAHKRGDETMFEAWQRISGGPHPGEVAGILSDEDAETMLDRIEAKAESAAASKRDLRDAFDDS
ncbi:MULTISPECIES: hypothetical protein [Salinibaculum]|uniref:hypothetical protein n=1 Tax=Salinibaculum TaxID=2732368 RepID=UPI0030D422DF